jgi:dolichyl-phosphate-mannose-protein mannosyltransferase
VTVTQTAPAGTAPAPEARPTGHDTDPAASPPHPPRRRFAVPEPLLPWRPVDPFGGWMMSLIVTTVAAVTRFWNISGPQGTVFDEVYYATESGEILRFGYENNPGFGLVVHPPLGKWMIAIGVHFFGGWNREFGWRFMSAVVGTLSVLITIRVARRIFRSDLLGALAGVLLTMDGVSMVTSRLALLDIYTQFFAVLAFAAMVLDRDQIRGRLAALIADGANLRGGPPALGPRPWRLLAGVFLGLLCAVKWSGLSFWIFLAVLSVVWDRGAFRSAGVRYPWAAVWHRSVGGAAASYIAAGGTAYLLTWLGWIVGENSWNRHWAESHRVRGLDALLPGWLRSLANYHHDSYNFHVGLTQHHPYGSTPWSWLILGRPTNLSFYGTPDGIDDHARCGATKCASQILLIGTPLMWWAFAPVLLWLTWHWLTTRDWRAAAVLVAFVAGWGAWLKNTDRTMFLFYMTPLMPFLVLGLTLALGTLVGRSSRPAWSDWRPARGTGLAATARTLNWRLVAAAVYVGTIVADFIWMWPIFTDVMLTYHQWHARMWFNSWI